MFRNKKSEILWGLNHKSLHMYGSKIVKRQDGSVQFYNFGAIRNGNPVLGGHPKLPSWSYPTCPPTFEKKGA